MHEVALAQAVWRQVESEMAKRPGQRLLALTLAVGRWSGADPESLQFALGLVAQDSAWPAAAVHMRSVPLALRCRACRREFQPGEVDLVCPGCGSYDSEVLQGRDVLLESIEVE
jgi:hydrogenase nickel incorporation protein HypA/HybF